MFLGVDGGGTKTAFCLLTSEGDVAASTETRSCYYFTAGIDLVAKVLDEGIAEICQQAGIGPAEIVQGFFGLPSYGEVLPDVPILNEAPFAALGHHRYSCENDMVCGWAGSLGMADGINVIAGTGSMTYGENDGRKARCGGWGEVFGDEGSAYWIAVRGLGAFSKMSDGRLPAGPLLSILKRDLDIAEDLEVVDIVLNRWKADRGQIAALSRTVVEAATDGDEACRAILQEAAGELVSVVEATRAPPLCAGHGDPRFVFRRHLSRRRSRDGRVPGGARRRLSRLRTADAAVLAGHRRGALRGETGRDVLGRRSPRTPATIATACMKRVIGSTS